MYKARGGGGAGCARAGGQRGATDNRPTCRPTCRPTQAERDRRGTTRQSRHADRQKRQHAYIHRRNSTQRDRFGRHTDWQSNRKRRDRKKTDLVDVGEHHEEHDAVRLLEALLEKAHPDHGSLGGEEREDPPSEHLGEEAAAALERRDVHVPMTRYTGPPSDQRVATSVTLAGWCRVVMAVTEARHMSPPYPTQSQSYV